MPVAFSLWNSKALLTRFINALSLMDEYSSKELLDFCQQVDSDNELQARIKATKNPQQILDIASSLRFEFSAEELRFWSRELTGPYFPWAAKGRKWRHNFFASQD